jgi:hypothetical protein
MSAHTPGPWHRNIQPASKYSTIFSGRNTHVARVVTNHLPDSEIEANCDLIAAAPELLQACKRLLASSRDYTQWQERGMDTTCPPSLDWAKEIEDEASTAIAKATGGQ